MEERLLNNVVINNFKAIKHNPTYHNSLVPLFVHVTEQFLTKWLKGVKWATFDLSTFKKRPFNLINQIPILICY